MSISNETLRSPASGGYACNGSVTEFTGSFTVLAEADVRVILRDSDGAETDLVLTTEYTTDITGQTDSFTVTTVATYASGNEIILLRDMALTQPTEYGNGGPYLPETSETDSDRQLLQIQQIQEQVDRCVKNAPGATSVTDPDSYLAACQVAQAGAETAETNAETAETNAEAAQAAAEAAADAITSVVAINTQTGTSYTLVLADLGKVVRMTNASANTLTIPTNASVAFATGSTIIIRQSGAGTTSVSGDTGVTLNGVSAGSGDIGIQYTDVMLHKVGTDEWEVSGSITTVA